MTEPCKRCGIGDEPGSGWEGERTELGARVVEPTPQRPEQDNDAPTEWQVGQRVRGNNGTEGRIVRVRPSGIPEVRWDGHRYRSDDHGDPTFSIFIEPIADPPPAVPPVPEAPERPAWISLTQYRTLRDAADVLDAIAPTCAQAVRTWSNRVGHYNDEPEHQADRCEHWSGWHDEGSPMLCSLPEGHRPPHHGEGIEWTDAEAADLIANGPTPAEPVAPVQDEPAASYCRRCGIDDCPGGLECVIFAAPEPLAVQDEGADNSHPLRNNYRQDEGRDEAATGPDRLICTAEHDHTRWCYATAFDVRQSAAEPVPVPVAPPDISATGATQCPECGSWQPPICTCNGPVFEAEPVAPPRAAAAKPREAPRDTEPAARPTRDQISDVILVAIGQRAGDGQWSLNAADAVLALLAAEPSSVRVELSDEQEAGR